MHSPELLTNDPFPATAFHGVQAASLESLFGGQVAERLMPGEGVFWEGDAADHVFILVEGCLRVYRTLPDGRRAILGFLYRGDTSACLAAAAIFTAEAVSPMKPALPSPPFPPSRGRNPTPPSTASRQNL